MAILPQNFRFILLLTTLLGLPATPIAAIAQAQNEVSNQTLIAAQTPAIEAKVAQFLQAAGGSYTKVSNTIWKIPYRGKSLANFDVLVITIPNSDLVIMGVTVAERKQIKLSQDLLYKLLKFNDAADLVKVGIDADGDLFIRIEANGRTMDLEQFKADAEQISAATDELHRQIKGSLTP